MMIKKIQLLKEDILNHKVDYEHLNEKYKEKNFEIKELKDMITHLEEKLTLFAVLQEEYKILKKILKSD